MNIDDVHIEYENDDYFTLEKTLPFDIDLRNNVGMEDSRNAIKSN